MRDPIDLLLHTILLKKLVGLALLALYLLYYELFSDHELFTDHELNDIGAQLHSLLSANNPFAAISSRFYIHFGPFT